MKFISTRGKSPAVSCSEAILKGLAPDGGLYVPEVLPSLNSSAVGMASSYVELAFEVLAPFFEGDELMPYLAEICYEAFNFDVNLVKTEENCVVLELFHGPTCAFKDFGARFLAISMEKLLSLRGEKRTILVATSGDTGGAVAAAFYGRKNLKVKVLYPQGRVSERQKAQLTCYDGNISSFEVKGSFDDCQKMVKDAFMDAALENEKLSSANSINIGRLLPQVVYYVYACYVNKRLQLFGDNSSKSNFIIPSGNAGNCTAAYWAMLMGAPIEKIGLAVNSNTTICDYLKSGKYEKKQSVATLANAMDVGDPSNMERLFYLFDDFVKFSNYVSALSVSDENIKKTIKNTEKRTGYIMCPHTACAEFVREKRNLKEPSIIVSTAHPAKFETIVEPLIGKKIKVPENLENLLNRPQNYKIIDTDYRLLF
ncbi:MAG: threonine synthase [Sphaerochaetaceae bacterium]